MRLSSFNTPSFFANPYELYAQLRAEGPVVPVAPGMWMSGRHHVVSALLRDRRVGKNYLSGVRAQYGAVQAEGHMFQTFARMLALMNPPHHTRLRALLMKAFNAGQVDRFRALSQEVADGLIDRMLTREPEADLVADFTLPLPVEVICRLMGLPVEEACVFTHVVATIAESIGPVPLSPKRIDEGNQASRFLEDYFQRKLAMRRRQPGNDLLSMLVSVDDEHGRLSDDEIVANLIFLFIAGHETSTNMMGNALVALYRHPEVLARLRADPGLMPKVVTECLRFDDSVQLTARSALEDIDIEGVQIKQGSVIFLSLGAANRDPQAYDDPDRLDIDRPEGGRRLAYGGGVHFCLGARLASIELEVALATLLRRLPGLRLTHLDELTWMHRNSLRGVQALKARWRASAQGFESPASALAVA
jgi:cytochrome P450